MQEAQGTLWSAYWRDIWKRAWSIVNLSGRLLPRLQLVLASMEPFEEGKAFVNHPLGDLLPRDGFFDLPPGDGLTPMVTVDVLQQVKPDQMDGHLRLCWANADWMEGAKFFERYGTPHGVDEGTLLKFRLQGADIQSPPTLTLRAVFNFQTNRWDVSVAE